MKRKKILFSFTSIFLLFAIIVFINLISLHIFKRIDFTKGKIYSLSKSSKKMVKTLPDRIIINAYFTKDLPVEYAENRKYLHDLLTEYRIYSKGKIKFKFIDPAEDKDALNEVRSVGILPIRFTQIQKDKYEVKEGYMGISFLYGDNKEIIPVVQSIETLEYDITSRIKKLISPTKKTVGIITGHKETELPQELSTKISNIYQLKTVNIKKENIPEDVSSIIIVEPKEKFAESDLSIIEQFILKGKPAGFLLNMFDVNMTNFWSRKLDLGLDEFFANYGIKILKGFVLDWQNARISVRSQQAFFVIENIVEYPLFPIATILSKTNPIVKEKNNLPLLFVSPIEITPKDDLEIEPIVKSSPKSWFRDDIYSVNPFMDFSPKKGKSAKGPFNLAVTINSKPKKTYKAYLTKVSTYVASPIYESTKLGRIFLITTAKFIDQDHALFLNILDWLTEDEDLINIRSKGTGLRILKNIPYGLRIVYKYSNIFFPPLCVVLFGVFKWRYRSSIRKNYIKIYG